MHNNNIFLLIVGNCIRVCIPGTESCFPFVSSSTIVIGCIYTLPYGWLLRCVHSARVNCCYVAVAAHYIREAYNYGDIAGDHVWTHDCYIALAMLYSDVAHRYITIGYM